MGMNRPCGTETWKGLATVVALIVSALIACKGNDSADKPAAPGEGKPPAPATSAGEKKQGESAPSPPASLPSPAAQAASAPPTDGFDPIGTEKPWGEHSVTLKEAVVTGSVLKVVLLIKNGKAEDERISSMMHFGAVSDEGDNGELDIMGGNLSCDGAIPPQGLFKCRLAYKFPSPPKEVKVRVGAGVMTSTVWFRVKGK